ncbi:MAG: 4Fe-4S dicluster domain-containing protein [Lutibacter sp.]
MDKESNKNNENKINRKDFIKSAVLVGAGVTVAIGSVGISSFKDAPKSKDEPKNLPEFTTIPEDENSDILIRMQRELKEAMKKPIHERKWGMIINTKKCVGCHACTISCIAENKLPPGVVYRPVIEVQSGEFPNVQLQYFPRPCMQCEEPPCVDVCPVEATWKREDGITTIDYDKCIGCRYCITACPYGARTSDFGHFYTDNTPEIQPYEKLSNHEYGKEWNRENHGSPIGNARKCNYCVHRLDEGELPACVTTCIGRANYFGDLNDPNSLVSEMSRKTNQIKLLEDKGTKPTTSYLI